MKTFNSIVIPTAIPASSPICKNQNHNHFHFMFEIEAWKQYGMKKQILYIEG